LLRHEFTKLCEDKSLQFLAAHKKHTGDNAAMIGFAAFADSGVLANNVDQSLSFDPSLRLV
jgi:tRNA A37 threonylcarbamoyltransferase TsaD